MENLAEQTNGVECRKDGGVLDEIPGAYKDIDTVMDNQSDLAEIVFTLKQIICAQGMMPAFIMPAKTNGPRADFPAPIRISASDLLQ